MKARTILLYGRTRAGKTAQIGELAEFVYKLTGKKTRLYTADKGGVDTIRPYIELGIVEVVYPGENIWVFLNNAVRGNVMDASGKWVPSDLSKFGLVAFEGLTAVADALMTSLAAKSAQGVNIGGQANVSITESGDGQTIKIGGNNMAHYNVVQTRITEEVWESQKLPVDFVLWTASVSKDDDLTASGKVLGPAVVGKSLTHEVPRWFNLSFRIDATPARDGKPEKHILYLGNHVDVAAGNAVGLGNTRTPLDSPPLPPTIEPASIVQAIKLIDDSRVKALDAIKKRIGTTS